MTEQQIIESNAAYWAEACIFCNGIGIIVTRDGNRVRDPNCEGTGKAQVQK